VHCQAKAGEQPLVAVLRLVALLMWLLLLCLLLLQAASVAQIYVLPWSLALQGNRCPHELDVRPQRPALFSLQPVVMPGQWDVALSDSGCGFGCDSGDAACGCHGQRVAGRHHLVDCG